MRYSNLLASNLCLFDGEGGGEAMGETTGSPVNTQRGKSGEYDNVKFGKQPVTTDTPKDTGTPAAGEKKVGVQSTSSTLEEKRAEYNRLINGEYKDFYTQDTQRIINDRFKSTKAMEKQLEDVGGLLDLLASRYGMTDANAVKLAEAVQSDTAFWEQAADEAGKTVGEFMEGLKKDLAMKKLQAENAALTESIQRKERQEDSDRQFAKWANEERELRAIYPQFDLKQELENNWFRFLIANNEFPTALRDAYEMVHRDEIAALKAQATEQRVVASIRAKGARPDENGTSSQSAFTVKDDVSKLSKKDMAEINRRAMRGEKISFG